MARALLTTIVCCINRKTNEMSMSLNTLAEEAGMGIDAVIKWTKSLETAGYLKVRRSKGGNHNAVNIYSLTGAAAETGLWNQALDNSEQQTSNVSLKTRAGVDKTERFLNESNDSSDDDDLISPSDSGEFILEKEGRDEQQNQHDASRHFLEDHGVKAPALEEAAQHPLSAIHRAFEVATEKNALDKPAYALSVLRNGEFKGKPAWMHPDYKPIGTNRAASGTSWNSSAVKTSFHKSSWSEFASSPEEAAPANA